VWHFFLAGTRTSGYNAVHTSKVIKVVLDSYKESPVDIPYIRVVASTLDNAWWGSASTACKRCSKDTIDRTVPRHEPAVTALRAAIILGCA
jgi:hypothetical protein